MKTKLTLLLALCLLLPGCGQRSVQAPAGELAAAEYRFDTMTAKESFAGQDGQMLVYYSYQLLTMYVPNLEELSDQGREQAERNMEAFNARMGQMMDTSVDYGRELGEMAKEMVDLGSAMLPYYDETAASSYRAGNILSVRVDYASYTGGAHPNSYTSGYLFDLEGGQFISVDQLADDPAAFASGVAEKLMKLADAEPEDRRAGYWTNYRDVINTWNQGTVLFGGSGMTVVFSPYELGAYALGTVELTVSYEELAPLLGDGGRQKLGL